MAVVWSGYIALGTYSGGVFTEQAGSNYARQAWSFGASATPGVIAGVSAVAFGNGPFTYNAFGFFAASSGGSPAFIYPLVGQSVTAAGNTLAIQAAHVWIDYVSGLVRNGIRIGPGLMAAFLQTDASALLPGAPYNNGNVQCFA